MTAPALTSGNELGAHWSRTVRLEGIYRVRLLPRGYRMIAKNPDGTRRPVRRIARLELSDGTLVSLCNPRPDDELDTFDAQRVSVTGRLEPPEPPRAAHAAQAQSIPTVYDIEHLGLVGE